MSDGYMQKLRERILLAEEGTVFVSSDFADIAGNTSIRQGLKRLCQNGDIRRVIRGVYEKPKYSALLEECVATDPNQIAIALARNYRWSISPCGNTALNLLGISTQVPSVWAYVSDGPYKTYEWNSTLLEFKHRANREITGNSYMTNLVIHALKTIGKSNVTPKIIEILSEKLSIDEKNVCLIETTDSTDWIYDAIKKICGESIDEKCDKFIRK